MKNNFFILFLLLSLLISCSEKNVALRRIEDINKAERKLTRNPKDEETLLEVLNAAQNGNREVRAEAMWVLSNLESETAYSDFLRASVEDPDFNVRCLAVMGLGKLAASNPEAIDSVKRAISDTDLQVQMEALKVAGSIKSSELLNPILDSLSSRNKWVRITAIEALKDYDDAKVDRALNLLSSGDEDSAVKSAAAQVIEYRRGIASE